MATRTQSQIILTHSPNTDTLLIGPEIGSADTPYGKLRVQASGATVRFLLEGRPGYVDLSLSDVAATALDILGAGPRLDG